jgi:hypothetical protein
MTRVIRESVLADYLSLKIRRDKKDTFRCFLVDKGEIIYELDSFVLEEGDELDMTGLELRVTSWSEGE